MRQMLVLSLILLTVAGCTTIGEVPPQVVTPDDPEPRTVLLSEMTSSFGWTYRSGPGAYEYRMESPGGDLVTFEIGSDLMKVNATRWRFERDAMEKSGRDLMLPESVFTFLAKHFGYHELVRPRASDATLGKYDLEPLTPPEAEKPAKAPAETPAKDTTLKGVVFCIDAGHGGKDPGGVANGVQEKDVALPVALKVAELLRAKGAKVLMTRDGDTYPTLDERVALANDNRVHFFVSIHANIAPSSSAVSGFEAFYNGSSSAGKALTEAVVAALDRATDSPNRGAKVDPRGLRVLEKTSMPATLIELGFLSNAQEAKRLADAKYQEKLAEAIVDGLVKHAAPSASVSR